MGGAVVATDGLVPWFPESLPGQVEPQGLLERFCYVVLEEIMDDAVLLAASWNCLFTGNSCRSRSGSAGAWPRAAGLLPREGGLRG